MSPLPGRNKGISALASGQAAQCSTQSERLSCHTGSVALSLAHTHTSHSQHSKGYLTFSKVDTRQEKIMHQKCTTARVFSSHRYGSEQSRFIISGLFVITAKAMFANLVLVSFGLSRRA